MVNFFTPTRSSCTVKPEAELAAGGGITVRDGLPSKPGHNNPIPVKEEPSAATANRSFAQRYIRDVPTAERTDAPTAEPDKLQNACGNW